MCFSDGLEIRVLSTTQHLSSNYPSSPDTPCLYKRKGQRLGSAGTGARMFEPLRSALAPATILCGSARNKEPLSAPGTGSATAPRPAEGGRGEAEEQRGRCWARAAGQPSQQVQFRPPCQRAPPASGSGKERALDANDYSRKVSASLSFCCCEPCRGSDTGTIPPQPVQQ